MVRHLSELLHAFTGPGVRVAPSYVACMILVGALVYLARERSLSVSRFVRWIFPRDVYLHPSHRVDIKVFLLNRVLVLLGAFNAVAVRTTASLLGAGAVSLVTGLESRHAPWSPAQAAVYTLAIAMVSDFCVYWVHRVHHELAWLWPFHEVHHSAEVLTPFTVYRKHPVYDLISGAGNSLLVGFAAGVALRLFTQDVSALGIAGANAVYVVFNAFSGNFRHSHIWLSWGPVLERVIISPAQHQIHHSRAPAHRNRNYGEIFALWDWMFGTLYVPRGVEHIEFGLSDEAGRALPQPHGTFRQALLVPFRDSWAVLRERVPLRRVRSREAG
ncbi:MAG: fatty acid hydroxylase [Alphaproteobacteria bacterium]|nr:fatty acid hydroxylase [Alphaproteobacteria bacterium]